MSEKNLSGKKNTKTNSSKGSFHAIPTVLRSIRLYGHLWGPEPLYMFPIDYM